MASVCGVQLAVARKGGTCCEQRFRWKIEEDHGGCPGGGHGFDDGAGAAGGECARFGSGGGEHAREHDDSREDRAVHNDRLQAVEG